ncbi:MAG: BrnT family toxin [Thermoleophilia bacterium]
MDILDLVAKCEGFQWDKGNLLKNWEKHEVSASECEQIFFNQPLVVAEDKKHSVKEARFFALGLIDAGRFLFIVFTVRGILIRVISARNMNSKERKVYLAS